MKTDQKMFSARGASNLIKLAVLLACLSSVVHGDELANLQLLRNRCLYFAVGHAPNNATVISIRHGLWAQSPFSPAGEIDLAASGFSLAALPAAVANGLIPAGAASAIASSASARIRQLVTKSAAATSANTIALYGNGGVLFHYYTWDAASGEFHGNAGVEISPIDTSLLMFGLLTCANYFGGAVAQDYAATRDAIRWHDWFDTSVNQFYGSYLPGSGFQGHWDWYTQETMLICLMAAMSDPQVDALAAWHGWRRDVQTYVSPGPNPQTFSCYATWFGDPFTLFYGQAFLDFSRFGADGDGVNWFQQGQTAYQGHVEFFHKERNYLDALTLGFHAGLSGTYTFAKPNSSGNTPIVQSDATVYTTAGGLDYYATTPAANPLAQALSGLVAGGGLFDWHGWPVETVIATNAAHAVANNYIVGQDISVTAVAIENYLTHRIHNLVLQDPRLCATLSLIFPALLGTAVDAPALPWIQGGNTNWFWQVNVAHDGSAAAQSGAIGDNQETWFQATTNGPGSLLFWWKVSSEPNDFLEFYAYTATQTQAVARISGNANWQQCAVFLSATNPYTMKWRYVKNGSVSQGADAGWVDQITWLPCPCGTHVPQLFFQDSSGLMASWVVNSTGMCQFTRVLAKTGGWTLKAAGDLDGDGVSDLLFQTPSGDTAGWFLNADGSTRSVINWGNTGAWGLRACGDYVGEGHAQLFFQSPAGMVALWHISTNGVFQGSEVLVNAGGWRLCAALPHDSAGRADLYWQTAAGLVAVWRQQPGGGVVAQVIGGTGA